MIFEVFTKTEDECNAYRILRNLEYSKEGSFEYVGITLHKVYDNNHAKEWAKNIDENYGGKKIKKDFIQLIESMAKLFGTSISLQNTINTANELIESETVELVDLQHMRAELTALIGDLGDNQETFIKNLAHAVDIKGQYSVAHSENTAKLSRELATELGLNEKTKDLIYYAGLLSNIGKIAL